MAGINEQIIISRKDKGHCPICDKVLDETFKKIFDKKYDNIRVCPNHIVNLGGK